MARQGVRAASLIVLLTAVLFSASAIIAQPAMAFGGMGGHGGFRGGPGAAFHGGAGSMRGMGPGFRGGFHGGFAPGFRGGRVIVAPGFHGGRFFVGHPFFRPFGRSVLVLGFGGGFYPWAYAPYAYPYPYYPSCGYYDPWGRWISTSPAYPGVC